MNSSSLNLSTYFSRRRVFDRLAVFAALSALVLSPLVSTDTSPASASLSVSYDFNTADSLLADFNMVGTGVSQSATGGINDSGAILAPGSADAVFSSKSSYSLGPVGSTYVFETFLQSVGNSGYSGVGFTAASPANASSAGGVYRPSDAIGISVHGGGYVFHNGGTDVFGNWGSNTAGITTIKASSIGDLLNSGSPEKWYKIVFVIVRDSLTTFDTRVEVWSASSTGALLRPEEADAIFEWQNITNNALVGAPAIYSYINFSGDRVRHFDNFSVNLSGGATVVENGAPVVLTTSAQPDGDQVQVGGDVLDQGASSLVERGFVFGATSTPVLETDIKVLVDPALGEFTSTAPSLPTGDYFVRAFAKNANNLVSYGVALPISVISSTPAPTDPPQPDNPPQAVIEPTPDVSPEPQESSEPIGPKKPKKPKAQPTRAPVVLAQPASSPAPTPRETGEGGSILMPILEESRNSQFSDSKRPPKDLRDLLATPIAYVLSKTSALPELPRLTPSQSSAVENGIPLTTTLVKTEDSNGYILRSAGWQVRIEAKDAGGDPMILDDAGNVILNNERYVEFAGSGFAPGSPIRVWLFSDPVRIANIRADDSGNFAGQSLIPEGVPVGEHTIQLNGLTRDGQIRSVALGVVVKPEVVVAAPAQPAPSFDLGGLVNLLWAIALGGIVFFFIIWRRRRKKEEEGEIPNNSGFEELPIFASEGFEPSQQFPNDSRRKIGAAAPPNRKRFGFKPKGA